MSMKIFSDEFAMMIQEKAGSKRVGCATIVEECFKDWLDGFEDKQRNTRLSQLSGAINLLAAHDLPDTHNVTREGPGSGFGELNAKAERNGMKSDLTLTPELEDMIQAVFKKFAGSISKSGISLSFVSGRLTDDPSLAKKFDGLVGSYLQAGKVKGFHLEGRTIKPGSIVVEENATGTDG